MRSVQPGYAKSSYRLISTRHTCRTASSVAPWLPNCRLLNRKIVQQDPFVSLDQRAVGRLIKIALEDSRDGKKGIKYGICGEHGGDPKSIRFCHEVGLDYVSCSPFRVPVARIAAAQAAVDMPVPE